MSSILLRNTVRFEAMSLQPMILYPLLKHTAEFHKMEDGQCQQHFEDWKRLHKKTMKVPYLFFFTLPLFRKNITFPAVLVELCWQIKPETFGYSCQGATIGKGKGKAVPLQTWNGPEGSRKLRFPDFMTMAQDGGKVVSPTHRPPLPPGNAPSTHFC